MSQPRVSVIVVSHGRPDLLCRAALSVFHQNHRPVELIIVTDHVGLAAISTLPFVSRIKRVLFENENISAARNIGIDHAAAEYIAFLDDDAVAEPPCRCAIFCGGPQNRPVVSADARHLI